MNINYDKQIKEIDDDKKDIAKAISLAIHNGDPELAMKDYNDFKDILVNKTKMFFINNYGYTNSYVKNVNSLIYKLSVMVGYDVSPYIFNEVKQATSIAPIGYEKEEKNQIEEIYQKKEDMYKSIGISSDLFNKLYNEGGKEKIDELDSLIKKVKSKTFMYKAKALMSTFKEQFILPYNNEKFHDVVKLYNVKDYDDLFTLNTEIDSFLVDDTKLSEEQRKIIEENRNAFRKRMNKKEDYNINRIKAMVMKKTINKLIDFNVYKNVFENTNIKDFIDKNNVKYTEKILNQLLYIFEDITTSSGVCYNYLNIGTDKNKYCFYNSEILRMSTKIQNNVITHESIHALEQKIEGQPFFSVKYKNINEAITEYFSRKAITYLNGNILPSKENDMKREPCSVYDSMLPLVEKLFASGYKEDFIQAKFFGDVKKLENKVGLVNMMKISKCFNKAFLKENEDIAGQKECVKEMEQILSRIGRIKR